MGKRLSEEEIHFIKEKAPEMTCSELTRAFNAKFNDTKKNDNMRGICWKHEVELKRDYGSRIRYTKEQIAFLETKRKELNFQDLTDQFNLKYGTDLRVTQAIYVLKKRRYKERVTGTDETRQPMGWDTALIVVDCTDRKGMDPLEIAVMLNRGQSEIEGFIEKLKALGAWEKIKKLKNMKSGPQALSHASNRSGIADRTTKRQSGLLHNI